MLLTVKALQGRECSLQVSPEERVGALKRLVAEQLDVPVAQQRLLYRGKALADELRLSDYAIGPEARLNLVLKPPERAGGGEEGGRGAAPPPAPPFPAIWAQLGRVLGRHFGAADAARVLEQLHKDYEQSLRALSLDDVERLAARLLQPEGPPPPPPPEPPRCPSAP
ncbi:ubiquitin-like protein 4A [Struthio camelus]|uniref:ubiquitin-like protein 4A n=1 Tax=Struthio camelus TaxID=8801 RepID=UPI00360425D3